MKTTLVYIFFSLILLPFFSLPNRDTPEPINYETSGKAVYDSLPSFEPDSDLWSVVDTASNRIIDSCNVLVPVLEKLARIRSGSNETVSILHIGDSHVQAGYLTGRLRILFQNDFGNAGRGLINPYRLAGMNEPRDYSIRTPYKISVSKAVDRSPDAGLGFNGMRMAFETPAQKLTIWSKDPFNSVTALHASSAPALESEEKWDSFLNCTWWNTDNSTRIGLSDLTDSLNLTGFSTPEYGVPVYYGFSLENGMPGVLYHEIGLNGAAFEHFRSNTELTRGGAHTLAPDLIVVALGTNNCYGGNFRESYLQRVVDGFVQEIVENYPGSAVLLVTPIESCSRRTVRGRRTYVPNQNIPVAAEIIRAASSEYNTALWDMYSAAGGEGANEKWFGRKLFGADHIHLSVRGYELQAEMFYVAFVNHYNRWISGEGDGACD